MNYINSPSNAVGILKKDINVAVLFDDQYDKKVLFKLPKGMVVLDSSPQGIAAAGMFQPNRITFTIIVPDNSVDYSQSSILDNGDAIYSYK